MLNADMQSKQEIASMFLEGMILGKNTYRQYRYGKLFPYNSHDYKLFGKSVSPVLGVTQFPKNQAGFKK